MIVVGVGGRSGAEPAALLELVAKALADHGRTLVDITEVATLDRRASSEGVRTLVEVTRSRLRSWPAETLAEQPVEETSEMVQMHVGTPSVAEAAISAASPTAMLSEAARFSAPDRPPERMSDVETPAFASCSMASAASVAE